jgi:glycosyltransferase involved in cell wall biosynthesis
MSISAPLANNLSLKMKQPFKLNLGAGHNHRPGWINIDIDPQTQPDVVHDLTQPLPYQNNTVSAILLQDILEHFTKQEGQKLLHECSRVLKKGGQIKLRLPNIQQIIDQFSADEEVMLEFIYGNTETSGQWGSHRYGYTAKTITLALKRAGFTNINIRQETTNFIVTAQKSTRSLPQLNLLVIQQSPDWGGAEEWMTVLLSHWSGQKISITGWTNLAKLRQAWQQAGIKVKKLPFTLDIIGNCKGLIKSVLVFPFALVWYLSQLFSAKKSRINLILMSGFSEKLLVTWLAQLFSLPVVWFEYGPLAPVFSKNFYLPKISYRLTKHLPKRVITISQHSKLSLITDARVSLSRLRVIYPGVILPSRPATLSQLIVGSLSRLAPEKGQRQLVRAWAKVIRVMPQAKLKIAGSGPDATYLQRLVHRLGLDDSVEFLGFVPNKSEFYRSLSLFVFPTVWPLEGFGLVAAEAMAHGLPVVAFHTGPVAEIVDHASGKLLQPGHIDQLATAIIQLLKNSSLRKKLGQQARKISRQRFNFSHQADKILAELINVLKEVI